VIVTSFGDTKV